MRYAYKAIAIGGVEEPAAIQRTNIVHGDIEATSMPDARAALRRIGLEVVSIRSVRRSAGDRTRRSEIARVLDARARARRVSRKIEMLDALSTLLRAGVPLAEAFHTAGSEAPGAARDSSVRLLRDLGDRVRAGSSLGDAMSERADWFDEIELGMIRAGEESGDLGHAIDAIRHRLEARDRVESRLASALAYPMLVLIAGIGVTLFLGRSVLPQLVGLLEASDIEPPGLTRAVIAIAHAVSSPWTVACVVVLFLAGTAFVLSRQVRRSNLLGIALPRPRMLAERSDVQLLRDMASLCRAGVPLARTIRLIAGSAKGLRRDRLVTAASRIESGSPVGASLAEAFESRSDVHALLVSSDNAGELGETLKRIADRIARRVERTEARLLAIVEPASIITLAALIGCVVMSAVLPLTRLQEIV